MAAARSRLRHWQKQCGRSDGVKGEHADIGDSIEDRDVERSGGRREAEEHHKGYKAAQRHRATRAPLGAGDTPCEAQRTQ
jgi:hypothetical protein